MPPLPRFDPLWLVIPAIAILIALGWPTSMPINPRTDAPRSVLFTPDPGRPVSGTAAVSATATEAGTGTEPTMLPAEPVPTVGAVDVPARIHGAAARSPADMIGRALLVAHRPTPPGPTSPLGPSSPPAASGAQGSSDSSATSPPSIPAGRPPTVGSRPTVAAGAPTGRSAGLPNVSTIPPAPPRPGDGPRSAVTPPPASSPDGGEGPASPGPPSGERPSPELRPRSPGALAAGTVTTLRWPLTGPVAVSRGFERPASPYGPGHRGIDLAAAPHAAVLATAAGTVSFAGWVGNRQVVAIDHGDLRTTYEPLTPTVAVGDHVETGTPVGWLVPGHLGCPVQACLHWGLLRGPDYLDPLAFFRRTAPRLLPLLPR